MSAEEREDGPRYLRAHPNGRGDWSTGRPNHAEREALKLWRFKPIDMTDEKLAEQAKARERERRARKRREKGIRTKAAYLAERASRPKPWIAQGISRSTYHRRRRLRCVRRSERRET